MGKNWNELKEKAVTLYLSGKTAPEVAHELETGETSIYRWLAARGVFPSQLGRTGTKGGYRRFSVKTQEEIARKYMEGASLSSLSNIYSCCPATVKRAISECQGSVRKRGGTLKLVSQEDKSQIIALFHEGKSQGEIGRRVGISQSRVSKALRSAGILPKHHRLSRGSHPMWKGGVVFLHGYRAVNLDPRDTFFCMANSSGYVLEHRLVLARHLKRPLERWETVHHIDGDRLNNSSENLQLRAGKHGKHIAYCCANCGSTNIIPKKI